VVAFAACCLVVGPASMPAEPFTDALYRMSLAIEPFLYMAF
jgi:hypothetical protein